MWLYIGIESKTRWPLITIFYKLRSDLLALRGRREGVRICNLCAGFPQIARIVVVGIIIYAHYRHDRGRRKFLPFHLLGIHAYDIRRKTTIANTLFTRTYKRQSRFFNPIQIWFFFIISRRSTRNGPNRKFHRRTPTLGSVLYLLHLKKLHGFKYNIIDWYCIVTRVLKQH